MKLEDKIKTYVQAAKDCEGMSFGQRNLLLGNLAKNLGLCHWFVEVGFELKHPNRLQALVKVK